jgi:hypothetical protein
MDYIRSFLPIITQAAYIGIVVFSIWGTIDNYFLTRYGGKLNRGFTIWHQALSNEARQFLSNLNEDIVEEKKVSFWLTETSFITRQQEEALICYRNPSQGTSWPIVFYVDLALADPKLQYRLSLPMLLLLGLLAILNIFIGLFFLFVFILSWFMEMNGTNTFLAEKIELHSIG